MAENIPKGERGPFVELGALHKLLDRLKPNDLECTNAWYSSSEPCCKEIVLRFRNLLNEWASDEKRVQDCLASDYTLTKCDHCGVIKCLELSQVQKNIVERKHDGGTTVAKPEHNSKLKAPSARPALKYTRKQEIMRNSHPVVPRNYKSNAPTSLEKLTLGNIDRNSISKEPFIEFSKTNSNKMINRLREKNSIGTSPMIVDKFFENENRKFNDIGVEKSYPLPLVETVKYLVRGNVTPGESQRMSDKSIPTKQSCFRKLHTGKKHSFALHGSRDADLHDNPGFVVCDRSRLDEVKIKNRSRTMREETTTKNDIFNVSESVASFSQPNNNSIDGRLHGSDTSVLSSSSAENLIRQWIKPDWNVRRVNAESKGLVGINDLPTDIRATATKVIKNAHSIDTQTSKANSCYQNEVDDNGNLTEPSGNLTKIWPSQHRDVGDSLETKSPEMSDDHELPGISRAMSSTMWDEKIIPEFSHFPTVASKEANKSVISSITVMSLRSCNDEDLMSETSERFEREILYDEISSHDVISSHDAIGESTITTGASKVLRIYRKILESNEEMDWESFEHLVSALHPRQRELWCDICKAVSNEARRVAEETGATTEVCIEINPLPKNEKKRNVCCSGDEISFELDMTLKNIHIIVENKYSAVSNETKKIGKPGQG